MSIRMVDIARGGAIAASAARRLSASTDEAPERSLDPSKDSIIGPHAEEEPGLGVAVEGDADDWQPRMDPTTRLVLNPALRCVKGEGLCSLRTKPGVRFQCICEPTGCSFRRKGGQ